MPKILAMILFFVKELVFESKEEYDINSKKFKLKKVMLFIVLNTSLAFNAFFIYRMNLIASAMVDRKLQIIELKKENSGLKDLNESLADYIKKIESVPSDSGNANRKSSNKHPRETITGPR